MPSDACVEDVVGCLEGVGVLLRVVELLEGRLLRDQVAALVQGVRIVAPAPHHLLRGSHPPVVEGGVVAEPGEQVPGFGVALGRRVEEEPRVVEPLVVDQCRRAALRDLLAAVGRDHVLQVADAHVVRDHRELLGSEPLFGDLQIARRARQGGLRVEALVDLGPFAAELLGELGLAPVGGLGDLPRQRQAAREVDLHPEQVGRGRRDDLREAGGRAGRAVGHHGRAARALQEDHRLEHVRVDAVLVGRRLDLVAPVGGALGGEDDAARALGVDHVRGAERRPLREVLALRGATRPTDRRNPRRRRTGRRPRSARPRLRAGPNHPARAPAPGRQARRRPRPWPG